MDADVIHQDQLSNRCRFGNCLLSESKGRVGKKQTFHKEFKSVFNVDVTTEDAKIYPDLLCNKHSSLLHRIKQKLGKSGEVGEGEKYSLFEFKQHDNGCSICYPDCDVASASDCISLFSKMADSAEREKFLEDLVSALNEKELVVLASALGKKLSKPIREDAEKMTSVYYDLKNLCSYNIDDFIENSSDVLRAFIRECCNIEKYEKEEKNYLLARIIELMYRLCYPWIVFPLAFLQNVCTYVSTRSRFPVELSMPLGGGSYDTILQWLVDQGSLTGPIQCLDGDIGVAFDNMQVLKKTYSISVNSKMESSVITNIIWISLNRLIFLQNNPSYIPRPWKLELSTIRKVQMFDDPLFQSLDQEHYNQLYYTLNTILSTVLADQRLQDTGVCIDSIDEKIEKDENNVKCDTCSEKGIEVFYTKNKRVCEICKTSLKKRSASDNVSDSKDYALKSNPKIYQVSSTGKSCENVPRNNIRYGHIPSGHPGAPPEIIIGEPIFTNPCSFANCAEVLRKIGKDAGIIRYGGKKRYWIFVCCDGLPFRHCDTVIHETFACTICHSSFFRIETYKTHCKEQHDNQVVEYYLEFDWVLLKPGGGHFEMNSVKSFVELNWIPFFSQLSEVLGFRSEKAKYVAKACRDHHKAWQMILMFYFGSLKELCTVYVRDLISSVNDPEGELHPTPEGFLEYCSTKAANHNFMYLLNQVTLYAQAIINYRMALRRNNNKLALSAIYKLSSLFHGRNHPFYQKIELYSLVQPFLFPSSEVKELHERFYTISVSGDPSKGEDWDFILENKNKIVKSWIPKGGCKDSYWLTGCRNADMFEKIKEVVHGFYNTEKEKKESTASYRNPDLTKEIEEWRATIRKSKYLEKESFCSISDAELDRDLVNFTTIALAKRVLRIDDEYLGKEGVDLSYSDPVFVTPDERKKYREKDVTVIKEQIASDMSDIISTPVFNHFKRAFKAVEKKSSHVLLKFHSEVLNYLSEESMYREGSDNEDCDDSNEKWSL